ncbi:hypothetical protein C0991_001089, partial [Blastosporella zonata]
IYGLTDRAVHGMPQVTGAALPVAARKASMGAATANDPVYVSQDQQEEKETAAGNVEEDTRRAAQLRLPDNLEDMCIVLEDDEGKETAAGNVADDTGMAAQLRLPDNLEDMCIVSEDDEDDGTMTAGLPLPTNVDEMYTLSEDEKDLGRTAADL